MFDQENERYDHHQFARAIFPNASSKGNKDVSLADIYVQEKQLVATHGSPVSYLYAGRSAGQLTASKFPSIHSLTFHTIHNQVILAHRLPPRFVAMNHPQRHLHYPITM